jgi:hypothetical protein
VRFGARPAQPSRLRPGLPYRLRGAPGTLCAQPSGAAREQRAAWRRAPRPQPQETPAGPSLNDLVRPLEQRRRDDAQSAAIQGLHLLSSAPLLHRDEALPTSNLSRPSPDSAWSRRQRGPTCDRCHTAGLRLSRAQELDASKMLWMDASSSALYAVSDCWADSPSTSAREKLATTP